MARPAVVSPSVHDLAEWRAAALALKAASKELRREISKQTREQGNPIWRTEIDRAARTKMDRLVVAKGARIKAGNPAQALAATSRRALSDGLVPNSDDGRAFEFGTWRPGAKVTYSRRGHQVTRRTKRQVPRPSKRGAGRVAYAAWARTGPRLVSLWTQTIYRAVYEAFGE